MNFLRQTEWQVILEYSFLGRTVFEYLVALGIFVLIVIVLKIFKSVIIRKLSKLAQKTDTTIDEEIISIIKNLPKYFYWAVYLYIPLKYLGFGGVFGTIIDGGFTLVVVLEFVKIAIRFIGFFLGKALLGEESEKSDRTTYNLFMLLAKIFVWALAILIFLSNIGVEITPLIAGLGIGGVAVAFAMQNILEDIFSTFTIYLDKPFNIGDYIMVGTDSGTVDRVGIKTSRITTLQGEQLVVPNKELTSIRINNFGKMETRRIAFEFGVVYETSLEKLKEIKNIVSKICEEKSNMVELDRVHFKAYGDFSLVYEVVYYVQVSDYKTYMDMQEYINFRLFEEFKNEGIEFAYPTRRILNEKME